MISYNMFFFMECQVRLHLHFMYKEKRSPLAKSHGDQNRKDSKPNMIPITDIAVNTSRQPFIV